MESVVETFEHEEKMRVIEEEKKKARERELEKQKAIERAKNRGIDLEIDL